MAHADFPLHRPELLESLCRGDMLLDQAMSSDRRRFRRGDEIIQTGVASDTVFRLVSGWVARSRVLQDGRRSIIMMFLPRDLFGVKTFLLTEQPDSIECLADAVVLAIKHDQLRQLFETEPSVALRIAFQLGEDERRMHNYIIGLGRASAEERIATMLIETHGRLVKAGICANGSYSLPLTQQDIGDLVGLTVVHVNRVLRRLNADGLVSFTRGMVQISDIAALYKKAEPILDAYERAQPEFGGGDSAPSHPS
ncbi:MAG: Crp/Fnr family transcriptional regulator [Alphaproteobacteria bacterium]|nr:Crp/Fnr family transcriptional regulator [Alphaproteobacteria bacterium]